MLWNWSQVGEACLVCCEGVDVFKLFYLIQQQFLLEEQKEAGLNYQRIKQSLISSSSLLLTKFIKKKIEKL